MPASLERIKEVPIFLGTVCEDMHDMCVTTICSLAWEVLYYGIPRPQFFFNSKYLNGLVYLLMCL